MIDYQKELEDRGMDLYISGKTKTKTYAMARCPFHGDDDPSFSIGLHNGKFRCFGCEVRGDFADLIAYLDDISVSEARKKLKQLDNLAGMYASISRSLEIEERPKYFSEKSFHKVYPPITYNSVGYKYLIGSKRKFKPEMIKRFDMRWGADTKYKNRVVIPIRTPEGKILSYVGISVEPDPVRKTKKAKSQLLGHTLFGIHELLKKVNISKKLAYIIVVEGECLSADTEVFTEDGWIYISDYKGQRILECSEDGTSSLKIPLDYIDKVYTGNLIHSYVKGYETLTTPNHNMVTITNKGRWRKTHADQYPASIADVIPRVTKLNGVGINLSNDQIALCLAVSADATIDFRKNGNSYVRFAFVKQRKVKRLRGLLRRLNITKVSDTIMADGKNSICFTISEWVTGKLLNNSWLSIATVDQRKFILNEQVFWDGNSVSNRMQVEYASKEYHNAVWMQTIAHLAGYVSTMMHRSNAFGKWWKVSILWNKQTNSCQCLHKQDVLYKGHVYCFTTSTGMFLARYHNKIFISGNSDAIYLQQFRVPAVSNMGTTVLTKAQINILKKYARTAVFSYDADYAGRVAVYGDGKNRRGELQVVGRYMPTISVDLPNGLDPNALTEVNVKKYYRRFMWEHL